MKENTDSWRAEWKDQFSQLMFAMAKANFGEKLDKNKGFDPEMLFDPLSFQLVSKYEIRLNV